MGIKKTVYAAMLGGMLLSTPGCCSPGNKPVGNSKSGMVAAQRYSIQSAGNASSIDRYFFPDDMSGIERDFDSIERMTFALPKSTHIEEADVSGIFTTREKRRLTSRHFFPNHAIPEPYKSLFVEAGQRYNVPPELLAAVFKKGEHNGQSWSQLVENYGGKWASSPKGASGPFQFIRSTWRSYGVDGDGDGKKDVHGMQDSAHGAARYLSANMREARGGEERKILHALTRYNGCRAYARRVYSYYQQLR